MQTNTGQIITLKMNVIIRAMKEKYRVIIGCVLRKKGLSWLRRPVKA